MSSLGNGRSSRWLVKEIQSSLKLKNTTEKERHALVLGELDRRAQIEYSAKEIWWRLVEETAIDECASW